jgi:hypothetical protein
MSTSNENSGSAMQVMLCPECTAKNRDYSISYRLAVIRQQYWDTTTLFFSPFVGHGLITPIYPQAQGTRPIVARFQHLEHEFDRPGGRAPVS